MKSGTAFATGARTDGVAATVTVMSVVCEIAPFVAVTESVYAPVEGESPALSVRVEVAVPPVSTFMGLGRLKLTPAGAVPVHEAATLTCPLNPFMDEIVTVENFVASGVRLIVAGAGWETKSGVAPVEIRVLLGVTFTWRVAVCEIAPLDAVTVKGYVPGATVPDTKIVSVGELIPPAEVSTLLGPLNEAVTPAGAAKVSVTGEAKPFSEVTNTFRVPDAPCGIPMPVVENAIEKSPLYSMNPHELAWHWPAA